MADESDFQSLLRRVRAGEEAAASELVGRVEPTVRAAARGPLDGLGLRRLLDSTDISQSVLANFFRRAAEGEFELRDENQLLALLLTMARNKVRDESRRQRADRRDAGRVADLSDHCLDGLQGGEPTPSRVVAGRELAHELFARLPDEVRYLAEQRSHGREWADLAAEQGSTAQALRKKMARALEKLAEEFHLDR